MTEKKHNIFNTDSILFQTGSPSPLFNFKPETTTLPGSFKFGVPRNDNASKGIHLMVEEKDSLISELVTCRVCFRKYCVDVMEPKLLVCGHSVCSSCLSDILKLENKMCPKCKKSIENNRIEDFTTNFDVLETVKRISDTIGNQHFYSLKALKELYFSVKNKLSENIEELKNLEKRVDDDLGEIQKYLDDDTVPHHTAFEFISKMEQNFRNLEIETLKKTTLKPTISLEHYKNFKSFIYDLSIRLHNKKERIFTYEIVRGAIKFGEVTLEDDDYITVHALTLDYATENACLVQLKDFKKCTNKCMHLFLELKTELTQKKMYFAFLTFSVVTLQTIKLCTGELGPCYSGSSSVSNNYLKLGFPESKEVLSFKVANHMIGDKDTWGVADYISFFVAQTTVPDVETNSLQTNSIFGLKNTNVPDLIFIKGFPSGQIEICSNINDSNSKKNIIGKLVTNERDLSQYRNCTISDSGIAFKLL